ncbi:MAG: fibronectin type III domain-containing protein, partial [Bacteroidales bacterium]|nr:fibronectin type III domain-containing protein [Bacteroidales bacterium]
YTQTVLPAELVVGQDYTPTIVSGLGSGAHGAAIWIDYNDDGVFAPNELVSYNSISIFPNNTYDLTSFTVPNNPGLHRLRLQYCLGQSGQNLDPCYIPTQYAETEDYLVYIGVSSCEAVSLPYALDFETLEGDGYPFCTSTQNFGGGTGWYVANAILFGSSVLTCTYDEYEDIDAWFYTRAFNVVQGEAYSIRFDYANISPNYTENLKVFYGSAPDKNSMIHEIVDLPDIDDATIHSSSTTFQANYSGLCYVGFNSYSLADQWLLYVDNILIEELTGCIYPDNITANNITASTASLEWTHLRPVDVVSYEIFYSTSNIAPDETTTPSAVSNSTNYTLTELSHSTSYYVWIRANCGGGDVSPWSAMYSFSTLCGVYDLPYFENFENLTDIPNCTSIENLSSGNNWMVTYNNDFNIYTLTYNYSSYDHADVWFYTPQFELEQNKSYKFSFTYFIKSNSYPENLKVAYGTSPSHIDMTNIIVDMPDIVYTSPTSFETIITPTATDIYTLGFNCYSLENQYTLFVTDISLIEEISECAKPENLSLLELNVNHATIQWDEPNISTFSGFDIYFSNSENAPNNATSPSASVQAGQTTYTINDLNPNTTYYAWVRSYCNETTFSEWLGPISFTTHCNSTTIPYELNFETANPPEMPDCVSLYNAGAGNNWLTEQNPGHGFDNMTIKYKANYGNAANAIFYTQALELQGGTTYNLIFKYGNNSQTKVEKLKVAYTQNLFEDINSNIIVDLDNITGASTNTYIAEFTPLLSGNYFIAFNCYSDKNQAELYIDDIVIDYATGCISPSNINLVSVSNNSVKIAWNEPVEPIDSYDIYFSTNSTEPDEVTIPTLTIDGS